MTEIIPEKSYLLISTLNNLGFSINKLAVPTTVDIINCFFIFAATAIAAWQVRLSRTIRNEEEEEKISSEEDEKTIITKKIDGLIDDLFPKEGESLDYNIEVYKVRDIIWLIKSNIKIYKKPHLIPHLRALEYQLRNGGTTEKETAYNELYAFFKPNSNTEED